MRRILFFTPLVLILILVALSSIPIGEQAAWRAASRGLAFVADPPDFLADARWTRSGSADACGDHWVRYETGGFIQNFPSHQYISPAQYRSAAGYFEVRKGKGADFLKRDGNRLIVYDDDFARPKIMVGMLYQIRCE